MDVLIDHGSANHLVNQIDEHRESWYQSWHSTLQEFEGLKSSGAMLGQASEACQLAVMRVNDDVEKLNHNEIDLIENVRHSLADDLRNEEESSSMFTPLGGSS